MGEKEEHYISSGALFLHTQGYTSSPLTLNISTTRRTTLEENLRTQTTVTVERSGESGFWVQMSIISLFGFKENSFLRTPLPAHVLAVFA